MTAGADDLDQLQRAAYEGRIDEIRARLDRGFDVNTCDNFGSTLLHSAVSGRCHALVTLLLDRGADPQRRGGCFGRSALDFAALGADAEMVSRLVAGGADATLRSTDGKTPLMEAALSLLDEAGQEALVRRLCEAGADPRAVGDQGWTPLHFAAFEVNKPGIARALITAGADVSAVDQNGWTPLHVAAVNSALATAAVLLEAGARTDVKSTAPGYGWEQEYPTGVTPIDIAKTATEHKRPSPNLIALLEWHEAKRRRL